MFGPLHAWSCNDCPRPGQPILCLTVIALQDIGRSEAGEADRLPPGTPGLASEFPAPPSVLTCLVEPLGEHQPQPKDRVGGWQMEGDVGVLADFDRLLEQAAPGVDRAAADQRPSGDRQDVGVGRGVAAALGVLDRFLDVSVHLLAGQQPRHGPRLGPNTQTECQRTAHIGGACRVNRLARQPIGADQFAATEGQERRCGQPAHPLVITTVRAAHGIVQASAHLSGQAALEPEADDRLGDVHQPSKVPRLRRPVHRRAEIIQIGRKARHPGLRLSTAETRVRPPGQPDIELQMAITHPIGIVQLGQPLPRIQPDRLQQPVAGPAVPLDDLQQRLLG